MPPDSQGNTVGAVGCSAVSSVPRGGTILIVVLLLAALALGRSRAR
ncbi:MAG: hypothetical protein KC503_31705 [Myxococcales bacterium]|nr:hypothetical protein [Myxococcales bacterium]